jgi:hypothetical protein
MTSPPFFTSASAQSAGSVLTLKPARRTATGKRCTRNAFPEAAAKILKARLPCKRPMTYMSLERELIAVALGREGFIIFGKSRDSMKDIVGCQTDSST